MPQDSRRLDLACAAAIFVAAAAYFMSFAPWTRPVLLDAATWDWMSLEIARGMVPYRDVFLHKTPGSALIGSLGVRFGQMLGLEPVLVAHAQSLLLGCAGPLLLFLICRSEGPLAVLRRANAGSRSPMPLGAALAVALALLAFDEWPIAALEGCRPKVPATVLGLASLLAAERGAPFAASLFGGMSVLCWQPGLAFLFGAWASIFARGERRIGRWFLYGLASLVPSVLLLGWLAWQGALRDFFEQAVLFNVHYIDSKARTPMGTLHAFVRTIGAWNDVETLLAPAALAGLLLRARPSAVTGTTEGVTRIPLSLAVSGAIYLAMTFVSYQSWPDAILLGPIVAAILGGGLWSLLALRLDTRAATVLALVIVLLAAVPDDKAKFHPPIDFRTQHQRYLALARDLGPEDRVIGVSTPEFFIHTGRHNGWKWPYLWFGVDDFAAAHQKDGFEGILADLDRDPPRMMLVARLWAGPQRQRFEQWAALRYSVQSLRIFPHLKRPLRVYRLR